MIWKYVYKYPTINFNFSNDSKWELEFDILLPEEIDFLENANLFDEFYLLRNRGYRSLEEEKKYFPNFPYTRVCFQPPSKGKNKWTRIGNKNEKIKIEDLPDLIDSSVNSNLHPKERNWFLYKHCYFSNEKYTKIDWSNWKNFGFGYFLLDSTFYYKIVCELIMIEIHNRKIIVNSDEHYNKLVKEQILYDGKYKFTDNQLNDLFNFYLRDFMYLWK